MALFNITNLPGVVEGECNTIDFKASNVNIRIDTTEYKISELQIEDCGSLLLDFKASNNNIFISTEIIQISQLQI